MQWIRNTSPQSPKNTPQSDATPNPDLNLEARLFEELLKVAREHPHLKLEDYDMEVVRQQIIRPIAQYMDGVITRAKPAHQPPIIVSGQPGIGKTTLLMMIDEALTRLDFGAAFSTRSLLMGGKVAGYYGGFKGSIDITPLHLKTAQTAVLSILDWRNIQRHWTYDSQTTYRETPEARAHFLKALAGKIIFVDDAEKEGHVYFVSQLAQQGILVVISSNLDYKALHIDDIDPLTVTLSGKDHRVGDIGAVCLPAGPDTLFDTVRAAPSMLAQKYEKFKIVQGQQARVAYARWDNLQDQPYLKDTFAEYFRTHDVDGVLLEAFPFFSQLTPDNVNPVTLGHLYRFVHLIDAVHDLQLPFMLRMTQTQPLASLDPAAAIEQVLCDYDEATGSTAGAAAWIEISRCVSRLRSRQTLNAAFFPAFLSDLG